MGSKDIRPHNSILEVEQAHAGLIPVKFEGDSLDFLRATMTGKIWPSREQIYAARAMLPIEHPAPPYANGMTIEEIEKAAIERFQQENAGEDVTEALCRAIDNLRRHVPAADTVRSNLRDEFDQRGLERDDDWIERICALVEERFPAEARAEVIPPMLQVPRPRKVEPVTIDVERKSAADDGISGAYEVEPQSSYKPTHKSDSGKPAQPMAQPSMWDDPAETFGDRGTATNGPYNPEPEFLQVTRGRNGRIGYIVNGKRRE